MAGQPKKYKTEKALRKAIDDYLASISYQIPAVVSTPTGEVDENGCVKYVTRMLTEQMGGLGAAKTETKFLTPPSVPGLCLYLGIAKSTLANYRKDEKLSPAVAYWDMVYEDYLWGRAENGKHIAGVMFNLKVNFGYSDKVTVGMDEDTRKAVAGSGMTMAEKLAVIRAAAAELSATEE